MQEQTILGVDTGGTFTDFVLYQNGEVKLHKVLSTPEAPEQAILEGMKDFGLHPETDHLRIIHGTTVATNAALEKKGAKTAFITNRGFGDLLTIGRQARKELYNLTPRPVPPPVPRELCVETGGRRDAKGNLVELLSDEDLELLLVAITELKPSAVAICLLFSFLDNSEESRIQQALESQFGKEIFVSRSSWVLPEFKEYERGIVTWYNAYLGPLVRDYLSRLKSSVSPAPLTIMQSSGSTISADQAALRSVNLLLSGPAGGLAAVEHVGEQIGESRLLSFDMGGTSTDVALLDGGIKLTSEGKIGDLPISVPMVDMHTIGAGGGSIAYLDASGMLHVGPESAGANPGPVCYGNGGTSATVSDANAALGRLQPDNFLGGRMKLHQNLADTAVQVLAEKMNLPVAETAQGVIDLANEHMLQALRLISEQRGYDPKEFVLCGFGGAGGLHICELAEALGMTRALIPNLGGVLSALGMLVAPAGRELSKANLCLLSETNPDTLGSAFSELEVDATRELVEEGHPAEAVALNRSVDCRYKGQSFFLNIPWVNISATQTAFHKAHEKAYGHCFDLPVELVNIRISANVIQKKPQLLSSSRIGTPEHSTSTSTSTSTRKIWVRDNTGNMQRKAVPLIRRKDIPRDQPISGPLLVCEEASTTWVGPGWNLSVDEWNNLRLDRHTN